MQNVTVNKSNLISILTKNRANHEAAYLESVVEFRRAAKVLLEEALKGLRAENAPVCLEDKVNPLEVRLSGPKHSLKEYDHALKMLEMSVEDNIVLTTDEFTQYVEDEWSWKSGFNLNKVYYGKLFGQDRMGCTAPEIG